MGTIKPKSSWQKVRKLFNDIHLWMGIGSGIIIFLVCLSGTIYTFSHEIQEMVESEKFQVEVGPNAEPLPAEQIVAAVMDSLGEGTVQYISIPADKAHSYQLNVKKEEPKGKGGPPAGGRRNRGTTYLVNPYTAEILGTTEGPASEFFMSMFRLHRWLLLDTEIGRPIVGWATVIFFFIILSGLVIWIPQKVKSWRQGLKIKWSGNWKRINHDLHNSLGFYSAFLLLIMALTGLTWSFDWYKEAFNSVLGVEGGRGRGGSNLESTLPAAGERTSALKVADYLSAADQALPYEGDYRISLPADPASTVSISKNKTGFFAPSGADRIQLDQYSGEVVQLEKFSDKPFNEQIASSVKALHTGEIFGTFSKILYFISCLIATSLPVTGTIIWINKLKKKKKLKKSAAKAQHKSRPTVTAGVA